VLYCKKNEELCHVLYCNDRTNLSTLVLNQSPETNLKYLCKLLFNKLNVFFDSYLIFYLAKFIFRLSVGNTFNCDVETESIRCCCPLLVTVVKYKYGFFTAPIDYVLHPGCI